MKKPNNLFSLVAILLIISSFLVDVIRAVPTNTSVSTANSATLVQGEKLLPLLTATPVLPPPHPQTTIPEPVDWDYLSVIMAMNITPSVTPTPRPTSTAPPPPEH